LTEGICDTHLIEVFIVEKVPLPITLRVSNVVTLVKRANMDSQGEQLILGVLSIQSVIFAKSKYSDKLHKGSYFDISMIGAYLHLPLIFCIDGNSNRFRWKTKILGSLLSSVLIFAFEF
jgi:hypothetical protein